MQKRRPHCVSPAQTSTSRLIGSSCAPRHGFSRGWALYAPPATVFRLGLHCRRFLPLDQHLVPLQRAQGAEEHTWVDDEEGESGASGTSDWESGAGINDGLDDPSSYEEGSFEVAGIIGHGEDEEGNTLYQVEWSAGDCT